MSVLIDTSGDDLDWIFRRGEQRAWVITVQDANGDTRTDISSCRVAVFTGTIGDPGSVVSAISITPTVTSNTTINFTVTSTHTRAMDVGSDYCWVGECTFTDGTIESIFDGNLVPLTEIA